MRHTESKYDSQQSWYSNAWRVVTAAYNGDKPGSHFEAPLPRYPSSNRVQYQQISCNSPAGTDAGPSHYSRPSTASNTNPHKPTAGSGAYTDIGNQYVRPSELHHSSNGRRGNGRSRRNDDGGYPFQGYNPPTGYYQLPDDGNHTSPPDNETDSPSSPLDDGSGQDQGECGCCGGCDAECWGACFDGTLSIAGQGFSLLGEGCSAIGSCLGVIPEALLGALK